MRKNNFSLQILISYNNHYINILSEFVNQFEIMNSVEFRAFCLEYGNVMLINNVVPDDEVHVKKPRYTMYLPLMSDDIQEGISYVKKLLYDTLFFLNIDTHVATGVQEKVVKYILLAEERYHMNFTLQVSTRDNKYAFQVEKFELVSKCFNLQSKKKC